jgi:hypothetical protein
MPAQLILTKEQQQIVLDAFYNDLGIHDSCDELGYSYRVVMRYWKQYYSAEDFRKRCSRLNRMHKIGSSNPMYGKKGVAHHSFKDVVHSTQGYRLVPAPAWYTGNVDKSRVLEHIIVWCTHYGYTELPRGYVVHHIDHSRTNNSICNLMLMTIGDHLAYHNTKSEERATTILQRSREKALPKRCHS